MLLPDFAGFRCEHTLGYVNNGRWADCLETVISSGPICGKYDSMFITLSAC